MSKHYLYALINNETGKTYIGVTKNLNQRFRTHIKGKTNPFIMKDRDSHSFRMDILEDGPRDYIYSLEEATIIKLNTRHPNGYNIAIGGCGGDLGRHKKGSECYKAKLSEDSVLMARIRHANGEDMLSLAKEYGVSHHAMMMACRGVTWKHVAGPLHEVRRDLGKRVQELKKEGFSTSDIATKLGISKTTVYRYCKDLNKIKPRDKFDLIISLKKSGLSNPSIASRVGVSIATIRNYCKEAGL